MWEDARTLFSYREVDMISGMLSARDRTRTFAPFVFAIVVLAALLAGPVPGIAQQAAATQEAVASEPRVLNLEDYPRWSRIGNVGLSPDGAWMSYSYDPLEGDNTLYLRHLDDDTTHEAERASGARFSDDSRWVAYMVSPEDAEGGGRGGRGGGRGGNGGGAGREATLMNLASGETFATGEADSFTFSDDGRFFVVKRRKADREAEHDGTDLVLRDLSNGLVQNIGNVDEFAFNGDADILAYTVDAADGTGNGLYVLRLDSHMLQPLDTSSERYAQLAWSDDGDGLAVLRGDTPEGMVQRANVLLAFTRDGDGFARTVFDPASATFPDGMVLSELSSLDWSENDARIFVGIKEQQEEEPEADDEETANVDVWHWRDERVQSVQQVRANRDRQATYTAAVHLADGSFVQLTDEGMPSITLSEDGTFGIGRYDKPYRYDITWGGGTADSYYVDASTGERRLLVEGLGRPIGLSPDGRWYAYLQNETVYVMDVASGEVTDLTALTGVDFVDRQDDHPYELPPYGLMGWSEDGDWILLEHRYDLWAVPLPGSGKQPLNLTVGLGDRDAIQFRYVDLSAGGGRGGFGGFGGGGSRTIDTSEPMLLSAYGDRTKKSGYYTVTLGEAPQPLIYVDKAIGSLRKADDAERVVFTEETFTEFPDYWTADGMTAEALASAQRVTDANPQQAEYAWSPGAVLIDYTDERGNELQATLSLPAGYEQGKRYPMLVYFYELMSQNHNRYSMPAYDDRPHFSTYTSNGYLVLRPDIVYTIGRPGDSAVDDLTSAVHKVIELGYADPDHIGLQGHSWGGYQSSFVLTQTDIFAAVVTGAPVTNLTSFYDELYKSSGNVQQGITERGQVRMGISPYEDWDLYMSQSPVHQAEKITTPFLILHGTDDGSVDWHQGLEYYNAARRLGKEVILLSYPGEGHHLSNKANQKDFQIRMKQFFDHYLMGKPAPPWMTDGVPFLEKGSGLYRQEKR
ncbi:MAG: prolyl oligopeptidase family serine peptidase [Acidobacteriota bacterium]|jgi:dipeptidyl aminopeptidase/acylaminoacyl peptidase